MILCDLPPGQSAVILHPPWVNKAAPPAIWLVKNTKVNVISGGGSTQVHTILIFNSRPMAWNFDVRTLMISPGQFLFLVAIKSIMQRLLVSASQSPSNEHPCLALADSFGLPAQYCSIKEKDRLVSTRDTYYEKNANQRDPAGRTARRNGRRTIPLRSGHRAHCSPT